MGKSKKFKSFAEETSREIQDLKAQVGSQLIQVLKSEERVEEITEKCLTQLKESAGNTLGDFAKALSDHEKDTRKKLYETNKREQSQQQSLNAIATKMDEVKDSNSSLLTRVNQLNADQSNKFYETDRKVKTLTAKIEALEHEVDSKEKQCHRLIEQVETLTNRLNELEQLVMMGRAKPKKSKKSVVIDPNEGEPTSFIPQQWAPPIKKKPYDQQPKKSVFDGVKLKMLNPDGSFTEVASIPNVGAPTLQEFVKDLKDQSQALATPRKDDPITAELKALEQFCNEKKKQGDAERDKVRGLPE